MADFIRFLNFLYKKKWLLLAVPLLTVIAAYFLVQKLPDEYTSTARIATGLVDKTDQGFTGGGNEQQSEVTQKFDNIIQSMQLKNTLNMVSYRLILHDLTQPAKAFHKPSKPVQELSSTEKSRAIAIFNQKLSTQQDLFIESPEEKKLLNILQSMHYDTDAISGNLTVSRVKDSDYIRVEFDGDDPEFTAFVVNTLCTDFISRYSIRLQTSNDRSIEFLEKFMNEKMRNLTGLMDQLKQYKIKNRVLNLNEQARSMYGQIIDFETRREVAIKDVVAYTAALKNIDNKFNPSDRRYLESTLAAINQNIVVTKQQLRAANDIYFRSNFDPKYKARLDSLQNKLTTQINQSTDSYIYNPLVAKTELVSQKLNMEIALELAQNSIATVEKELVRLNRKFDGLVPNEAKIQEFETSIDIASKEYIEALQRYNNAKMQSQQITQLKLIEKALPGTLTPSKKVILIVFSGIISFVLCLLILFLVFYLDNSIHDAKQLANSTDIPVIGTLHKIDTSSDLTQLWHDPSPSKSVLTYRNALRSIRFELDHELTTGKVIALTSLRPEEGKTTLLLSLAHAFAMINKRVLIVDGNFSSTHSTSLTPKAVYVEDFLHTTMPLESLYVENGIYSLSNNRGDYSLFELASETHIAAKIAELKSYFDVILIETPALETRNKAKEWIQFADKVVAVYEAHTTIRDSHTPGIQYLKSLGDTLVGWVLTKATTVS
ncbi:exopolysaccharide transport family protein [Siphonobacter curvatus]|uniref:Lipopolysaccharide biosynthesis protein n=1 Tax=Siphonobacter curvatus TaxID=2094562 RepID=A0A2S7II88_9BACT|nr:Wzz/FepE/Etk N-terminal domain-containing protein [Siphonobacter curvatus]PQA56110.1 lipopolysaccharide biosynthesis protein [Siphonobacter curvatus]